MNLFNNGGNGALTFDAKYREDFSRKDPLIEVTLPGGVEFETKFKSSGTGPPSFKPCGRFHLPRYHPRRLPDYIL